MYSAKKKKKKLVSSFTHFNAANIMNSSQRLLIKMAPVLWVIYINVL